MTRRSNVAVSSLLRRKSAVPRHLNYWFRHVSSLQSETAQRPSAKSYLDPSARPVWAELVGDSSRWWVKRSDFGHRTGEVIWVDPQTSWVEEKSTQYVDSCRASGQVAESQGADKFELLRLNAAVEELDLLVQQGSFIPDSLFYSVLKGCTVRKDVLVGSRVHGLAVKSGRVSNTFLANHIIRMYASHGKLLEATQVFTRLDTRNAFSWFSIIVAHADNGQPEQATRLYQQMRQSGVQPNNHIFAAVLKACASAGDLQAGKQVHGDVLLSAVEPDLFVGNSLVDMYAKCGSLDDAQRVFDSLPTRNAVTWNTMLAGYAQHGLAQQALNLYSCMQKERFTRANHVTFVCLLKACAVAGCLKEGEYLHSQLQESGIATDVVLGNCLVDMYAKCGSLDDARKVFDGLPTRDVVTWNALITGYAQHNFGNEALALYSLMQEEGTTEANHVTFISALKACTQIRALSEGKELHFQIEKRGLDSNVAVGNCLVDMYSKCGNLEDARKVFERLPTRDVITWNSMIAGYAEHGLGQEALVLYGRMQAEGQIPPNQATFVCALKACVSVGALHLGKQLHVHIQEEGLEVDVILGTSLVDLYAKHGNLEDARRVFDRLASRNLVTWNVMIAGYVQQGLGQEALSLYVCMQQESVTPDHVTLVCLLKACASVGALCQGQQLHLQIKQRGLEGELGSSLVDMYVKCGSLQAAREVFNRLPTKDVVTWTALVNGYAQHNQSQMAIQCFHDMQEQGVIPDDASFLCLLLACCHDGLVNEGLQYFRVMVEDYGIAPSVYHHTCMVDLLGRAGCLKEAENILQNESLVTDVGGWMSLLSSCRSHSDVERGKRCFDHIVNLEPQNAAAYGLLMDIYTNAGRLRDVHMVESLRKAAGACKKPARAWIEVNSNLHSFIVGDERDDISAKLKSVNLRLEEGDHVQHMDLVPEAKGGKEDALCGHAEKLALAYGLLNTPDGSTLLVTKNLRMCNDCHSGTKAMSKVEKREIIVRDAHRIHHFVDGVCSCGDRH